MGRQRRRQQRPGHRAGLVRGCGHHGDHRRGRDPAHSAAQLKLRVVNVVDLMCLPRPQDHPHGLDNTLFRELFTDHVDVVFAFHGFPGAIHQLVHGRPDADQIHVRVFIERHDRLDAVRHGGKNEASGYHLVIDAMATPSAPRQGRASSRPGAQSSSPDISGMSSSTSRTCPRCGVDLAAAQPNTAAGAVRCLTRWSDKVDSGPAAQRGLALVGARHYRPGRLEHGRRSAQILRRTYAFRDGSIVFRTAPYERCRRADRASGGFEVDQFDTQTRTGWRCWWSASPAAANPEELVGLWQPTSPCRGRRAAGNLFIVIKLDQVSGRAAASVTEPAMNVIRIFLLDDHEIVRRGLRDLFEAEPDMVVVGRAARRSTPTPCPPSGPTSPCWTPASRRQRYRRLPGGAVARPRHPCRS